MTRPTGSLPAATHTATPSAREKSPSAVGVNVDTKDASDSKKRSREWEVDRII